MKARGDAYTKPGRTPGRVTWNVSTCKLNKNTKGEFTLHACASKAAIELYATDADGRAVVRQALRTAQKELEDCIAAYKRACSVVDQEEKQ